MFIFRLYNYEAVSELCSLQLFLFKEIILMIYIFKYEDYEKQINFFKNTRMVIING